MSEPIKKEIKDQIIDRITNQGISVTQAATDHGISTKTIYTWLSRLHVKPANLTQVNHLKRENEGLYSIIGKLTTEISKLKKGHQ